MFLDKPFDLDRLVRLLLWIAGILAVYFLLDRLSAVLIPFFLAWLTAYILEPIVRLVQRLLKRRVISAILTLLVIGGMFTGLVAIMVPVLSAEFGSVQNLVTAQLNNLEWPVWIPKEIAIELERMLNHLDLKDMLQQEGSSKNAASALSKAWDVLSGIFGALGALFGAVTYLLYLAFIMIDYQKVTMGWRKYVPQKFSKPLFKVIDDMEEGMNGYFKAQSKIVFVVAILFAIGFKIIGLPFAITLGIILGIMNYIPYSQLIGIFPAIGLTALHSLQTGDNFWFMMLMVLIVFAVVQLIQDAYLTPKFMGDFSGFNPAVILLSLSIWGSLLGIIGVIIAIPLTSILLAYYRRFILKKS